MAQRSKNASLSYECCTHSVGTQEINIRFYVIWLDYGFIAYFLDVGAVVNLLHFYKR